MLFLQMCGKNFGCATVLCAFALNEDGSVKIHGAVFVTNPKNYFRFLSV